MSKSGDGKRSRPNVREAPPPAAASTFIEVSPDPIPPRRATVLCGLLLIVGCATAAAHWPVLSAGALSLDDHDFVVNNRLVKSPGWESAGRFFVEVLRPSTVQGYYLPLSMTSLMLDYAAGGRADYLRPFHRTSLALHVANTLLVLVLLYALFGDPWSAAVVSLVFGLHPLTVEPVAWVGERKTLLAAFFALLCLLLYVRWARHGGRAVLAAALVAYGLALLSKPTSWPLWLVLILMDFWPLSRLSRRTLIEKWPFYIAAGLSAAITALSHSQTPDFGAPESALQVPARIGYLLSFYAGKMVWPSHLSSVYPLPEPLSICNPVVLTGLAISLGLALASIASLRRTRALLIGGLIFLTFLLPTLGLIRYSWVSASDKYLYLPAIGLMMLAAHVLARCRRAMSGRPARIAANVTFAMVLLAVLAAEVQGTRAYLKIWQSTESLGRHMVELAPRSSPAHTVLANALAERGEHEEAARLLRLAVAMDPRFPDAHYSLAGQLIKLGHFDEALVQYREAYVNILKQRPDSSEAHENLAHTLLLARDYGQAVHHYREALRYGPERAELYDQLGLALGRTGDRAASAEAYARAVELSPQDATSQYHLANALAALGRDAEAVPRYEQAIRLRPGNESVHNNLGNSLVKLGQPEAALAHYREAIRLRPQYALAHMNLADALLGAGQTQPALDHYREAVRLEPRNANAHMRLGRALERLGQPGLAAREYQQVLEINPQHAEARKRLQEPGGGAPATRGASDAGTATRAGG